MAGEINFAAFQPQSSIGAQFVAGMDAAEQRDKANALLKMQLSQGELTNKLTQYQLSQAARSDAINEGMLRDLATAGKSPEALAGVYFKYGKGKEGIDILQNATKNDLDRRKLYNETIKGYREQLGSVTSPDEAEQVILSGVRDPVLGTVLTRGGAVPPEELVRAMRAASATPDGFQKWVITNASGAAKLAELMNPHYITENLGDTSRVTQVGRFQTPQVVSTTPTTMTPYQKAELPLQQSNALMNRMRVGMEGARLYDETGLNWGGLPATPAPGAPVANTLTAPGANALGSTPPPPAATASGLSPRLQREVTGSFLKDMSKAASDEYQKAVNAASATGEQLDTLQSTLRQFSQFSNSKIAGVIPTMGTGPIASLGGLGTYLDANLESLDAAFKTLSVKNLTATFKDMSKAIDSNTERQAWNVTQPNITLDDKTNAQILVGQMSLAVKAKAEADARKDYVSKHKSLDGYVSPVFGKLTVVFDESGNPSLVSKSNAAKGGKMTADKFAEHVLSGKLGTQPSIQDLLNKYN